MNDPITLLRKDHREAEALLKRLESSKKPGPQRKETVAKLDAALKLHMSIEEKLVYPVAQRGAREGARRRSGHRARPRP